MTVAILADELTGAILAALLQRAQIDATAFRAPRATADLDGHLATLRRKFTDIVWVDAPARTVAARPLSIAPSLAAWLTRDGDANADVLGTAVVPAPDAAAAWLGSLQLDGDRRYSATVDGRALAARLDLGVLAAASPDFRGLLRALRPDWATTQPIKRGPGRPPGVALFRGTGYALCVELLHLGEGAEVTPAALIEALRRTKTPVLRLVTECQRRGYVQRTSARGALVVRNATRLLDDLVASVRAERIAHPPSVLRLRADRDPAGLPARVAQHLAERGRVLALTGAAAVVELGGDALLGAPTLAYANTAGVADALADAYADPRNPTLVLIEPSEAGVLHRLRPGPPARVSPWQAVIDLLASESDRERDVGAAVRRRLERTR